MIIKPLKSGGYSIILEDQNREIMRVDSFVEAIKIAKRIYADIYRQVISYDTIEQHPEIQRGSRILYGTGKQGPPPLPPRREEVNFEDDIWGHECKKLINRIQSKVRGKDSK